MIRNRIKEFRMVKASELKANPKNWRVHPKEQKDALKSILSEIGYADACLARELSDGSLELIDGHLRQSIDPDQLIPVLILDIDEAEADKLMAVLDPLASMAGTNAEQLDKLLFDATINNHDLRLLLEELSEFTNDGDEAEKELNKTKVALIPEMELRPYEHYDYVILLCKERTVFANLCDKLKLEKQHQMGRPKKIGLGRAINGQIILDMLAGVTEDTPMVVIDSAIGIDDEELSRSKEKTVDPPVTTIPDFDDAYEEEWDDTIGGDEEDDDDWDE